MGNHTKFESSDDESSHREKKSHKKEKKQEKKEKRDRSRSPREKSPKRDRHGDKSETRRREPREDREHGNRERHREQSGRDEGKNWKRDRNERRNDFQRKDEKNRLTAEEIAVQRKALWGTKKCSEPAGNSESQPTSSEGTTSGGKNEKLWSSAIAATGVDSSQANKFMRLMGVKNAPKTTDDSEKLSDEKNRQDKMQRDLEKQYAVARETTHMGRGMGFGFGR